MGIYDRSTLGRKAHYDQNNNEQLDPGEAFYTENLNLLLRLNNQSFRSVRPEIRADGIYVELAPGTYRLDIDPAGFPIDWQTQINAYAVEVSAGSYTSIPVPFSLSYTVSGVATDSEGNPIGGAKVEAVAIRPKASLRHDYDWRTLLFSEALRSNPSGIVICNAAFWLEYSESESGVEQGNVPYPINAIVVKPRPMQTVARALTTDSRCLTPAPKGEFSGVA